MTAKARRQFRAADFADPDKAAKGVNDVLLDIYRRLEAEEDEIAGVQTTINNLDPTALALAAFGSSANSSGASVSYSEPTYTLTLQPADSSNPGGISTGSQTFPGSGFTKTFSGQVDFTQVVQLTSTNQLRFNSSSAEYIRYAGTSLGSSMDFASATGFYFGGRIRSSGIIDADRFGVENKDDQSGTPGNFTTTRSAGRGAFTITGAGTDTTIVITNNTAGKAFAATDDAFVQLLDLNATLTSVKAVCTANTLTITGNAAATVANCKFSWFVLK